VVVVPSRTQWDELRYSSSSTGLDRLWRFLEAEAPRYQSNRHSQPYAPASFTPTWYRWYSFLSEVESIPRAIVRPEGLCQWIIPMTPSGIEPATFQLEVRGFDEPHHHVHPSHPKNKMEYQPQNRPKAQEIWFSHNCPQFHQEQFGTVPNHLLFCSLHKNISVHLIAAALPCALLL